MDVGHWLRGLGLGQYEATFLENEIDAEVLLELTETDLEKIGVPLGHRKRLLKAIASLNPAQPRGPPLTPLPQEDAAERRQLTVMFCDLVGSTAMSARLDLEDMREVIRAFQDACSGAIARYDGFVAKFMGDGVLAYFGFPRAHEEDAERAVRAGLDIAAALAKLEPSAKETLKVRIGVATGIVVVGDLVGQGSAQEQAVVGETPNLAARLQGLAEPGSVVIAESTRRLLGGTFELTPLGPQTLKGFDAPVPAWTVLREAENISRFEASRSQGMTPFVGREHEVALLLDRWRDATEGEGQVVLLSGEAGIGKSRILAALAERIGDEPHVRVRYQCSPHHVNDAFYPITSQIWHAAGFVSGEPTLVRLDKLEAMIARSGLEAKDIAPFLAALLSIPAEGRYPPIEMAPAEQKERTIAALIALFEGLTKEGALLALLEDAHWIDPTSLDVFSRLVDRLPNLRALLFITSRPEFVAPWVGRAHVASLALNRFGRRQALAMVDGVVGGNALPAEVLEQIVAKTDGVPLFVEELTKTVLESGLLREEAGAYVLDHALTPLAIPSTLQDSLMARLDRLAPVKEIAQIGAAIGREFSYRLLEAAAPIQGSALQDALGQLMAAELIHGRGAPPEATYVFKHALVQDTAYASMLRSRRQRIHADIARALEQRFADQVEAAPAIVAHHYAEAGSFDLAISYWLRAGTSAAARSANREAIAYLRRGLDAVAKLADGLFKDRLELDLQSALGPCLISTEGPISGAAVANFTRARELCERLGSPPEHQHVLHWLAVMRAVRGELPCALEATETATELAETRSDRPALINSLRGEALVMLLMGRLEDSRDRAERALAIFDAADEAERLAARAAGQDAGVATLAVASWALWALGYSDTATARIAAALERAKSIEHPHTSAYAHYYASILYALRGQAASSLEHAESCLALAQTHDFVQWRGLSRVVRLLARNLLDPASGTVDDVLAELDDHRRRGYQMGITALYVLALQWLLLRQELDAAREFIAAGLAIVVGNDERLFEAEFYRMKAQALLVERAARARAEAQTLLVEALATARRQAARSLELRAATDLARLWRDSGSPNDPRALLEPILAAIEGGESTRDVRNARALLAEIGDGGVALPHGANA